MDKRDALARMLVGDAIAIAGIWHPYLIPVNAKIAATIAAVLGFIGGIVVAWD